MSTFDLETLVIATDAAICSTVGESGEREKRRGLIRQALGKAARSSAPFSEDELAEIINALEFLDQEFAGAPPVAQSALLKARRLLGYYA